MNNTQVIINKQPKTVQEKPIREVVKCYELEDDNYIDIWNDGVVSLVGKNLKLLKSEQYDPEQLEKLIQELDKEVKEYESRVENY